MAQVIKVGRQFALDKELARMALATPRTACRMARLLSSRTPSRSKRTAAGRLLTVGNIQSQQDRPGTRRPKKTSPETSMRRSAAIEVQVSLRPAVEPAATGPGAGLLMTDPTGRPRAFGRQSRRPYAGGAEPRR